MVDLSQGQLAILVVVGVVAWKLLDLGTVYFFKRITRDDVVLTSDCEGFRKNCAILKDVGELKDCTEDLRRYLNEIRGIMLVVAVKAGINPEELKNLMKVG